MDGRWKVRRARHKDGNLYHHAVIWSVWTPEGVWSGDFDTWTEAMEWATTLTPHVQHWLDQQPRRRGYFGQPANRDDEGHL